MSFEFLLPFASAAGEGGGEGGVLGGLSKALGGLFSQKQTVSQSSSNAAVLSNNVSVANSLGGNADESGAVNFTPSASANSNAAASAQDDFGFRNPGFDDVPNSQSTIPALGGLDNPKIIGSGLLILAGIIVFTIWRRVS